MDAIPVTRENLYHIDFDSVVVFSYAEPGAMGEAGTIEFSTAAGALYRMDYLHGEVSLGEFRRAYRASSFETQPIPPLTWGHFWLGAGNHLLVHEAVRARLDPEGTGDPERVCLAWRNSLGKPLLSKQERYRWLIEKARDAYPPEGSAAELTWCDACEDEINLWTYWQGRGNLDPDILLVGQDWGNPRPKAGKALLSVEEIKAGPPYDVDRVFPTDRNLMELFRETFGIDLNRRNGSLFFTNLVLGYRTGSASGSLDTPMGQDQAFFKELVGILRPKAVICLGGATFDAALAAYGEPLPYSGKFMQALDAGRTVSDIDGVRFFGMGHCGTLGCMNRAGNRKGAGTDAGLRMQMRDWKQIREYLQI